ncbi:hypothetical protein BRADI_3g28306v3 [Brachypodium distachyon]|uniref:Uncharacterized protein n=1 Tax=Brachypodium distachyon TaxID=15368 RepID=A0A0Q3JFA0_BRADI|nr:hypothetical protein BRADI_3g28306v3 [Brachypodium distachyon]
MGSLAGLYGGGRGSASGSSGAWRAPAPVRQLYWRVRKAVLPRRPRRGEARFGYDLQSYSRNFDDGQLVSA